jgi:hypothetical protein
MAVDVNRSSATPWSIVSISISVIIDHRNYDLGVPCAVDYILHICPVKTLSTTEGSIFILRLIHDNRSAVRYLRFSYNRRNACSIAGGEESKI